MRLEAEKNKLENLLTNNLIRRRDEVLHALQEISLEDRKRQLENSKTELEEIDRKIKKVNKDLDNMEAKVKEMTRRVGHLFIPFVVFYCFVVLRADFFGMISTKLLFCKWLR